jgi:hypothetical protein
VVEHAGLSIQQCLFELDVLAQVEEGAGAGRLDPLVDRLGDVVDDVQTWWMGRLFIGSELLQLVQDERGLLFGDGHPSVRVPELRPLIERSWPKRADRSNTKSMFSLHIARAVSC